MKSVHPEYENNAPNWSKVRDIIKGEKALKDHDLNNTKSSGYVTNMGDNYVPYTSRTYEANDIERYRTYVKRASLFNATRRTEKGMVGMVFNKPANIELPLSLEYLNQDVDGSGISIIDLTSETLEDILETGRAGLFVDFPVTDGVKTIAEMADSNFRATIVKYKAEQIMDWRTVSDGATQKLSYVKLYEISETQGDTVFETNLQATYRVLLLEDGIYKQREYSDDESYVEFIPLDNMGEPFDFIPFFFIGATDNRPDVDIAPLLEIAEINLKHYVNSADYEESIHLVGQPMAGIMGVTQQWIEDNYPNGIDFGSRVCIMLPPSADIKLIQADPNTMASEAMKSKESQMIMLGARLIQDGSGTETAEAARIRHSADTSVMKVIVNNITNAFIKAIMAVQVFNGMVDEFTFELNTDFFTSTLTSQDLTALVSAWQSGAVDGETMLNKLKSNGF